MTGTGDPRVCAADGGDHDWQDRTTVLACGRPISRSVVVTIGTCGKCALRRMVTDGPAGARTVEDTPPGGKP